MIFNFRSGGGSQHWPYKFLLTPLLFIDVIITANYSINNSSCNVISSWYAHHEEEEGFQGKSLGFHQENGNHLFATR